MRRRVLCSYVCAAACRLHDVCVSYSSMPIPIFALKKKSFSIFKYFLFVSRGAVFKYRTVCVRGRAQYVCARCILMHACVCVSSNHLPGVFQHSGAPVIEPRQGRYVPADERGWGGAPGARHDPLHLNPRRDGAAMAHCDMAHCVS